MSIVALDPLKLLVLMACGGFAVAGPWLMFRPKPEGGAAKLELFGMKFEASSAGLLVSDRIGLSRDAARGAGT